MVGEQPPSDFLPQPYSHLPASHRGANSHNRQSFLFIFLPYPPCIWKNFLFRQPQKFSLYPCFLLMPATLKNPLKLSSPTRHIFFELKMPLLHPSFSLTAPMKKCPMLTLIFNAETAYSFRPFWKSNTPPHTGNLPAYKHKYKQTNKQRGKTFVKAFSTLLISGIFGISGIERPP